MSDIGEKVQEAVADVADEVSEQVADFAEFTRQLNKVKIQFGLLGAAIGATTASLIAFKVAYLNAERKYSALLEEEVEEMAEHYRAKGRALEAQAGKSDLASLVREKGYNSPEPEMSDAPPMAVQPPQAVLDAEDARAGEPPDDSAMAVNEVEGANGVRARGEEAVRNVFKEAQVIPEWDRHAELRRRSPDRPYVVHVDERYEMEGYNEVTLTYYVADDVLCDERDEVVDPERRDDMVGEANLDRFGHGSNDPNIVYIRNDNLEILYEIVRSPNSYAEEVHGLPGDTHIQHGGYDSGNLERMRRRERNAEH